MKIETRIAVEGMSCGSCVRHVGDALRGIEGVFTVEVNLRDGEVLVRREPLKAPLEKLVAAVRHAGYEAAAA